MSRGNQYENELAKKLDRATDDVVNVYPVGYSGNSAEAAEDLLLSDARSGLNYALEVKNYTSDEHCYFDPEKLEALVDRNNGMTVCAIVMKFSRREPLVVQYVEEVTQDVEGADDYNDASVVEKLATIIPNCFDPRITDSGKLAITKPSTDDWPSATAGSDDEHAVLSGLGITTEKSVTVE